MAVAHADYILELQSNLDRKEMPPSWMWPYTKEMNAWLDRVQADRKKPSASTAEDDNMQGNELVPPHLR